MSFDSAQSNSGARKVAVAHSYNYTLMIRIYVLIRRNGCTLIVRVRTTRITSMLFIRCFSLARVTLSRELSLRVFTVFPFPPSPSLFFLFSPRDIAAYRRHVCNRRWIFFISRDPRSNPSPGALKSITYLGFYPPDRSRVRSITYS